MRPIIRCSLTWSGRTDKINCFIVESFKKTKRAACQKCKYAGEEERGTGMKPRQRDRETENNSGAREEEETEADTKRDTNSDERQS